MGIETNSTNSINSDGLKISSVLDRIRQELERLLSENDESDYTVITLWQSIENKIEWNDYFYVLSQLIYLKKIHIEEDGYISWLWNPNLINKLQKENLLLEWGRNITQIGFINERAKVQYYKLKEGDYDHRELAKLIDNKIQELTKNPFLGSYIKKTLWPDEYKKYSLKNLRKINLNENYRMIYTIVTSNLDDVVVLIEWFDHKEYERRFGYT